MAIKINDYYKSGLDQAADRISDYAKEIKHWRENHSEPDESKIRDIEHLYAKLDNARKELKYAIEHYYGINL